MVKKNHPSVPQTSKKQQKQKNNQTNKKMKIRNKQKNHKQQNQALSVMHYLNATFSSLTTK